MSSKYRARGTRSAAALMAVMVAVAGLIVATPASTAAAVPKCQGKAATIVGTKRDDVLRGTKRADVIVAKRGNDTIVARGGNDLICAGPGADVVRAGPGRDKVAGGTGVDVIYGALGPDVLRGNAGNDVIRGGDGGDAIDGGLGFDNCAQGAGEGPVVNCEKIVEPPPPPPPPPPSVNADLAVSIASPARATSGRPVDFTVTVANLGPDASPYVLKLSYATRRAECQAPDPDWTKKIEGSSLDAAGNHLYQYSITCDKQGKGASVTIRASVTSSAQDPDATNNVTSSRTSLR